MSEKLSFALWTNAAFCEYQVVNTVRSILNNDGSYALYAAVSNNYAIRLLATYVQYCPVEK